MTVPRRAHHDRAHHHPAVHKMSGHWAWACGCGGASSRTTTVRPTWHRVVIEALAHSASLAA
jgi:hypothetical protein